jgi:hypothetical protein
MMNMSDLQITGRDDLIEPQAFVLAIGYIQSLPPGQQSWSNMNDMCKIARAKFSSDSIAVHIADFYRRTGVLIDLFPDDEDDTINQEWKDDLDGTVSILVKTSRES